MRVAQYVRAFGVCLSCVVVAALWGCSDGAQPAAETPAAQAAQTAEVPTASPAPQAAAVVVAATAPKATDAATAPAKSAAAPAPVAQSKPAESPKPVLHAPATVQAAVKVLDLTTLPKLSETRAMTNRPTSVEYYAKGKVLSVAAFYRAELLPLGWKELTPAPDETATLQYHESIFGKDQFYLKLTIGESGDEGEVVVHLNALGNIDARALPVVAGATSMNSGIPNSASYLCASDFATAATQCRELLLKSGWKEYHQFQPFDHQAPTFVDMSWIQNGVILFAYVSSTPQFQNGQPTLSYHLTGMLPFDMPIMTDATDVKLEGATERFEYVSPSELSAIVDFYQTAYPKLGWKQREEGSTGPKGASLFFEHSEDLVGLVQISLPGDGESGHRVTFTRVALPKQAEDAANRAATTPPVTTPADVPASPSPPKNGPSIPPAEFDAAVGDINAQLREALKAAQSEIDGALKTNDALKSAASPSGSAANAADQPALAWQKELPLPKNAGNVEFERDSCEFETPTNLTELLQFFDKELAAKGWKAEGNRFVTKNLSRVEFTRNDLTLDVTLLHRAASGNTLATIEVDGLPGDDPANEPETATSSKPAPKGEPIRAAEFPLPPGAEQLTRDAARQKITFRHADGGDTLKEFFAKELDDRGWFLSSTVKSGFNDNISMQLGFYLEERSLSVEIETTETEKLASVTISGDGLKFPGQTPGPRTTAGLEVEEKDGLPVPKNYTGYSSSKSRFRTTLTATVPSQFENVLDFYNAELPKLGWKASEGKPNAKDKTANLAFLKDQAKLKLKLRMIEEKVEVQLITRDEQAAKAAGILPQAGKARIIMGNAGEKDVVIDINGTPYIIKAGAGAMNPADGKSISPAPGKYTVTIKFPGQPDESETLTLGADETWGIIVLPTGGYFADALY